VTVTGTTSTTSVPSTSVPSTSIPTNTAPTNPSNSYPLLAGQGIAGGPPDTLSYLAELNRYCEEFHCTGPGSIDLWSFGKDLLVGAVAAIGAGIVCAGITAATAGVGAAVCLVVAGGLIGGAVNIPASEAVDCIHDHDDCGNISIDEAVGDFEAGFVNGAIAGGLKYIKVRKLGATSGATSAIPRLGSVAEDLAAAETHLGTIVDALEWGPNRAMLDSIKQAQSSGRALSAAERSFLDHELLEAKLVSGGMAQPIAHQAVLKQVPLGSNYSPEVLRRFSEWFSQPYFDYWGLKK
jgi:hypothetical protein